MRVIFSCLPLRFILTKHQFLRPNLYSYIKILHHKKVFILFAQLKLQLSIESCEYPLMTAINEKLNKGSENKAARRFFHLMTRETCEWRVIFNVKVVIIDSILLILTMLNGQNSVRFLLAGSIDWFSFLTSLMNNPLDSGAMKYRLQEFTVLPGLNSIVALEPIPSSGRNLSCS